METNRTNAGRRQPLILMLPHPAPTGIAPPPTHTRFKGGLNLPYQSPLWNRFKDHWRTIRRVDRGTAVCSGCAVRCRTLPSSLLLQLLFAMKAPRITTFHPPNWLNVQSRLDVFSLRNSKVWLQFEKGWSGPQMRLIARRLPSYCGGQEEESSPWRCKQPLCLRSRPRAVPTLLSGLW